RLGDTANHITRKKHMAMKPRTRRSLGQFLNRTRSKKYVRHKTVSGFECINQRAARSRPLELRCERYRFPRTRARCTSRLHSRSQARETMRIAATGNSTVSGWSIDQLKPTALQNSGIVTIVDDER